MRYTYTNKQGELITKDCNFDMKTYNTKYYLEHKEHLNQRLECGCGLMYARSNSSAHRKGRVHKLYEKLTKKEVEII